MPDTWLYLKGVGLRVISLSEWRSQQEPNLPECMTTYNMQHDPDTIYNLVASIRVEKS